jgi:hypothetical protein
MIFLVSILFQRRLLVCERRGLPALRMVWRFHIASILPARDLRLPSLVKDALFLAQRLLLARRFSVEMIAKFRGRLTKDAFE